MDAVRFVVGLYCIISILCLTGEPAGATQAYVTDSFTITLRSGPSTQNKIIAMLPSGKPLEILETEGDWSHVRILKSNGENMEGWVLKHYVMKRVPWESQASYFRKEHDSLKEQLDRSEKKGSETARQAKEVSIELKETTQVLQELEKNHETLKKGAAGYLKLKTEHETAQSTLDVAQDKVQSLSLENKELKSSRRNTWFVTGALVLLCGFFIGLMMGRHEKKRKKTIFQ